MGSQSPPMATAEWDHRLLDGEWITDARLTVDQKPVLHILRVEGFAFAKINT